MEMNFLFSRSVCAYVVYYIAGVAVAAVAATTTIVGSKKKWKSRESMSMIEPAGCTLGRKKNLITHLISICTKATEYI